MKLLVYICIICTVTQAQLKPIFDLEWSDTMASVQYKLRSSELRFNSTTKDIFTNSLSYLQSTYMDYEVENWSFTFYKDRFYTYTINLKQMHQAHPEYEKIRASFDKAYGKGIVSEEDVKSRKLFRTYTWLIKNDNQFDDIIELTTWRFNGVHISIQFYYGLILDEVNQKMKDRGF